MRKLVIAIDGPAGAGKSTIGKELATRLGVPYFSTGSLYRALGLKCLKLGLDANSATDAEKIAKNTDIEVVYKEQKQFVLLDGVDVSNNLYTTQVSDASSQISVHPVIRQKLVDIQRNLASKQSIIMDGRDIGSVVLPMAKYKFYLDADVNVRAKRRYDELINKGSLVSFDEVLEDMKERDYRDKNREISPLIICKDAKVIDSTNLSVEEVVNEFISKIN